MGSLNSGFRVPRLIRSFAVGAGRKNLAPWEPGTPRSAKILVATLSFLLFALEPAVHPHQQASAPLSPYTEQIRKEFKFYPGGKIQFHSGVPGNLKIMGWNRASVSIEAEKILYRLPPEEAKLLAGKLPIQVRYTQTTAVIRILGIPASDSTAEININLYVPKDRTDLKVALIQGELSIESVQGWVEATLKDGSIEAKSVSGYFSLVTQQGDVSAQMSGTHWDGLGFTAATLRGAVLLQLPLEYSAALQLETRDGDFIIEYPEQVVDGETVPLAIVQNKKVRSLTASVGRGGAPIRIHTASGNVHLTAAP